MIDLIEELAGFSSDPLGFVIYAFPWGEPDSELEYATGPEKWQEELLSDLGKGLITIDQAIRLATTSGHGIGKSALVSWVILWGLSTMEDTMGVVTANTETQLKTKTWVQLAKWYRMFIGKELFDMTATKICSVDPSHADTWRVDMVPWSERNTEAFAGMHNKGKRIILVFDEASAIPDMIWEVSEGALTDRDTQIIWAVFGNPTKNKGRFRECFKGGKFAHRWNSRAVDSREVTLTDKGVIQEWIDDYGEDSDFVRVRVRGVFPRVDAESFISFELATEATMRTVLPGNSDPLVLGVDVGRFGDDPSIILPRRGRDARSFGIEVLHGFDTMHTASRVAATFLRLQASIAFVDEGGVGAGVVDRLRQLRIPVMGVDFGSSPDLDDVNDGTKYANKRAEIWGRTREWLKIGCIPERVHGIEVTFVDELTAPNYGLNGNEAIQLESKKEMRRRGIKSPNLADALACTFAYNLWEAPVNDIPVLETHHTPDYNPYTMEALNGS
jgi:hypothetical protein